MRLSATVLAAIIPFVAAHPGEHHDTEPSHLTLARRAHHTSARRGLEDCANKRSFQELERRAIARRANTHAQHRKMKRANPTGVGHNMTSSRPDITADSDDATVFGSTHTCILNPEGEIGPFYVPGEYVREDVAEDQPGIPLIIEGQFINVETCEPITNLYWDLWNCNSTGVYSGVVENGNGNANDASNINATFLRGIQETDDDGVVKFQTIFPGHYSGRTTHHHLVTYINATVLENNTLTSGYVSHIGQLFWDQDLIYDVEATSPYSTNSISITTNAEDRVVDAETTDSNSDPFFDYVYLGDDLSDGLFGWVTIGINTSATYQTSYSFEYTSGGGVAVGSSGSSPGGGGGAGGPGGSGPPRSS